MPFFTCRRWFLVSSVLMVGLLGRVLGDITQINAQELADALDQNNALILVNAMPPKVYKDCHIQAVGSINVPFYQKASAWKKWEKALLKKHPKAKDEPIYVYCASYSCAASEKVSNKLQAMGFKKIFEYKGGMREWLEKYGKKRSVGVAEMEYLHQ